MTRDEFLSYGPVAESTQTEYDTALPTNKVDLLARRREEKVANLSGRLGDKSILEGGVLDSGARTPQGGIARLENTIGNELTDAEYQGIIGQAAAEEQVFRRDDGSMYQLRDGQEVPFQGSATWLYSYGTGEDANQRKLGVSNEADPAFRYDAERHPDWGIKEAGANPEQIAGRMELLLPTETAYTLEALGHGRQAAQDSRLINQDSSAWDRLGTGASEYYDSSLGLYGDSRDDVQKTGEELSSMLNAYEKQVAPGYEKPQQVTRSNLQDALLQRESSGDYTAENRLGYIGGYQFGAQALETLGYLKPGASKQGNKVLNDPNAWTGKNGVVSKEAFLSNPEVQDIAFQENVEFNLGELERLGRINSDSTDAEIKGYLAAAHLLGAEGTENLDSVDASNISGREYYNLGAGIAGDVSFAGQGEPDFRSMSDEQIKAYYKDKLLKDRQAEIEAMGPIEKSIFELGQTVSGGLSGVGKGIVELADVAQEIATYPLQTVVRLYTGDDTYDIDWLNEEAKKNIVGTIDEVTGYERGLDEADLQKAVENLEDIGVDITSWDSIKSVFTDPEKRSKLGDTTLMVLANPSLTVSMVAEIVGAGGALGAVSKVGAKVAAKYAPDLAPKLDKIFDKSDSKVANFVKGTTYTNADMVIRMNNDIQEFMDNNEGEAPSPEKIASMAILNRLASNMEIAALKKTASALKGQGNVVTKAAKATGGLLSAAGIEGGQETLDGIVEQVNQKLGSSDYADKTLEEILQETSAEILTGTLAGAAGGVHIKGAAMGAKGAVPALSVTAGTIGKGINKVGEKMDDIKASIEKAPPSESIDVGPDVEVEVPLDVQERVNSQLSKLAKDEEGNVDYTGSIKQFKQMAKDRGTPEESIVGFMSDLHKDLRAANKKEDARRLATALADNFPDLVSSYGSDKVNPNEAREAAQTVATIIEDEYVEDSLTGKEPASVTMDNLVTKVREVDAGLADSLSKSFEDVRKDVEVMKEFNKATSLSKVEDEVFNSETRGIMTYYQKLRKAIAEGDEKGQADAESKLKKFRTSQENKLSVLQETVAKMQGEINEKFLARSTSNQNPVEIWKQLDRDYKGKSKKVQYGTHSDGTPAIATIYYDTILENLASSTPGAVKTFNGKVKSSLPTKSLGLGVYGLMNAIENSITGIDYLADKVYKGKAETPKFKPIYNKYKPEVVEDTKKEVKEEKVRSKVGSMSDVEQDVDEGISPEDMPASRKEQVVTEDKKESSVQETPKGLEKEASEPVPAKDTTVAAKEVVDKEPEVKTRKKPLVEGFLGLSTVNAIRSKKEAIKELEEAKNAETNFDRRAELHNRIKLIEEEIEELRQKRIAYDGDWKTVLNETKGQLVGNTNKKTSKERVITRLKDKVRSMVASVTDDPKLKNILKKYLFVNTEEGVRGDLTKLEEGLTSYVNNLTAGLINQTTKVVTRNGEKVEVDLSEAEKNANEKIANEYNKVLKEVQELIKGCK